VGAPPLDAKPCSGKFSRLLSGFWNGCLTNGNGGPEPMQPEDFRPDDLFAQIEGLVEAAIPR
jgi:hypothetical protein